MPGDEFDRCKRLRQIVVATCAQSAHPIVHRAERTQDQYRRAHALAPQRFDDRETVHARQQAIDDHDFRFARTRLIQAFDAVGGPVNVKTAIARARP